MIGLVSLEIQAKMSLTSRSVASVRTLNEVQITALHTCQ
jgi:hypothetical protein